jgi:hypothetical protein
LRRSQRIVDRIFAPRCGFPGWFDGGQRPRPGKGRSRTGEKAAAVTAQFKARKAAESAMRADKPRGEIKALRAAEDAAERVSRIGDRLALKQTHKPTKSEATWIEPKPPAPSFEPVPEPTKLLVRKAHPRSLQKRKLSEAEVKEIAERGAGAQSKGVALPTRERATTGGFRPLIIPAR